ncbi:MAG: enoyl-CoA hydratase/isomerase family protein [Methylibium sp.]|uniref:enoyl-CoA hydratase/isomerase family protein n=1 Tax=Methylibium sp. TaxID=2067992 RepID=UPI0017D99E09|nr:enoyl-CoA hydratase/isomerase family protein [Methylibium sp.]MBA2722001.1 enoyl-CoA hydratase/isomerase family protein [Methylibium sp.]MBA3588530.1 enoyl-CoA hydratase/isomerase family protein [Methylibium sp.]
MSELVRLSPASPEGLRTLELQRPDKANALSAELVDGIHASLDAIGAETRALLITGEGKNFCAGFDFTAYEQQSEGDLLLRFVRIDQLLARLRAADCLTIAWVSGAAFGAGADIACSCAIRIGTPAARFRFPGFQFGVALGTRRLAAIAGAERARRILLHNEELDAHAALECGLLSELSEEVDPQARVEALMHSTRKLDATSLRSLFALTDAGDADRDLAELVRSVSRPGLHARIAAYRRA